MYLSRDEIPGSPSPQALAGVCLSSGGYNTLVVATVCSGLVALAVLAYFVYRYVGTVGKNGLTTSL